MMDFADQVFFWHWLIAGVVLLILEVLVPAYFFLWLGLAALVVGLITAVFSGLALEWQLLLFSVLAVVSTIVWRIYGRRYEGPSDRPNLNKRGHQYIGRVFTLEQAIENGVGKISVDDSTWKVVGVDLPAGARVRVDGVDGTILTVQPLDDH
ncbi:MAG: NfeD family protein [Wenzhouxiangellaceae bacterium]